MASCEKCWRDAPGIDNPDDYVELVRGRTCTPEEQAGEGYGATECPRCRRMTVHIYCLICMVPGCDYHERQDR